MPSSTITSKGQLTVPKEVRERLGLHPGDKVDFRIEENGTARIVPITRKVTEVLGMLSPKGKKKRVSVPQMDENLRTAFRKGRI